MNLLMLGASKAQFQGIIEAKAMGHQVFTCDYLPDAPGHAISDGQSFASTFDVNGVREAALTFGVDGIMTMGTDQPVYTAALAQQSLGLPRMLDVSTALSVTNKRIMKRIFSDAGLPTLPYAIIGRGDGADAFGGLEFPLVLKPVDSQGQRGIFIVHSPAEALERFDDVVAFSREDHILAETYYPHDEVTVSGWVTNGSTCVLSITDRITFDTKEQIGICLGHVFPTKFKESHGEAIIGLSKRIVEVFNILDGPIYFQMLLGEQGIMINEIACRIGGAYESVLLPELTGFDLCGAVIQNSLGLSVDVSDLQDYDFMTSKGHGAVELFFAQSEVLTEVPSKTTMDLVPGLLDWGLNYDVGDRVGQIQNATARAGYGVLVAKDPWVLKDQLHEFYEKMQLRDSSGKNMVIHRALS